MNAPPFAETIRHRLVLALAGERQADLASRTTVALLVGLLITAAAVRLIGIGKQELWLDECSSLLFATDPRGVLHALHNDTNAPLYFFVLKGWIALWGSSAACVRSLSLICGVLQLLALAGWLFELGLPRRVALWGVLIGVCSPLQIHYAQEARGYTLTWLLVALALWAFTRALRRRSSAAMALHGLALLAALYTHNLIIGFVPACWAAALLMQPRRREWIALLMTQAIVGLLYLPWFLRLQVQSGIGGLDWILPFWQQHAPWRVIPYSILTLGGGGNIPTDLWQPVLPHAPQRFMRWLVALAIACAGLTAFQRKSPNTEPEGEADRYQPWRAALILAVLLILPLLLPFLYSVFKRPIYLIGRYDTLVYPPLLGLLAVGTAVLQRGLARLGRPLALILPLVAWSVPAWYMIEPRLPHGRPASQIQADRGAILAQWAKPRDLIVGLGHQGAYLANQELRHVIPAPWVTFPTATREHLGWLEYHYLDHGATELIKDADQVIQPLNVTSGAAPRRLWLLLDSRSVKPQTKPTLIDVHWYYEQIFRQALAARRMHLIVPAGLSPERLKAARLEVYESGTI